MWFQHPRTCHCRSFFVPEGKSSHLCSALHVPTAIVVLSNSLSQHSPAWEGQLCPDKLHQQVPVLPKGTSGDFYGATWYICGPGPSDCMLTCKERGPSHMSRINKDSCVIISELVKTRDQTYLNMQHGHPFHRVLALCWQITISQTPFIFFLICKKKAPLPWNIIVAQLISPNFT